MYVLFLLILGNATLLGKGLFGQTGQVLETYMFYDRIYGYPYEITVSVLMSGNSNV